LDFLANTFVPDTSGGACLRLRQQSSTAEVNLRHFALDWDEALPEDYRYPRAPSCRLHGKKIGQKENSRKVRMTTTLTVIADTDTADTADTAITAIVVMLIGVVSSSTVRNVGTRK
jgi:hypothetical protein